MNILWITNIIFPEANGLLTGNYDQKESGGWMLASADALLKQDHINLAVATVCPSIKEMKILDGRQITYYLIPLGKGNKTYNTEYEGYWKTIQKKFNPDIVHIHGTEFSHGAAYVRACGNKNVVVSIQGLVGEIGRHYCDGLSHLDILKNITLRDILKGTCFKERKQWIRRGKHENELIASVNHIIGRTSWDKAHVWAINPNAEYHHCDETLREEFYTGKWEYAKCIPHTIFVSQAYYPIKGLHILLKALPLIMRTYPDVKVRIAGSDVTAYKITHLTSYFKYLKSLIKKNGLSDHICFCGSLSGEEMKQEYLNANVFVCPSSIENSSNALSEAQILGVPCIASYVGGLPTLMSGNENCMYRFEDSEMLGALIRNVFTKTNMQTTEIRRDIQDRHNPEQNMNQLLQIYQSIENEI